MSSMIESLYEVKYNPFIFGEVFVSFYSSLENVKKNFLLAPLIIPLYSYASVRNSVENALFGEKRRSSIWSIFEDRTLFSDLQERIENFRGLTEECILYCISNDWLSIDTELLSVIIKKDVEGIPNNNKVAKNLSKLLKGMSLEDIYTFFEVHL